MSKSVPSDSKKRGLRAVDKRSPRGLPVRHAILTTKELFVYRDVPRQMTQILLAGGKPLTAIGLAVKVRKLYVVPPPMSLIKSLLVEPYFSLGERGWYPTRQSIIAYEAQKLFTNRKKRNVKRKS